MTHLQLKQVLFPPSSHKTRDRTEKGNNDNLQHKVILEWEETQERTSQEP